MRLIHNCQYCNKQLVEVNRYPIGDEGDFVEYKCGHVAILPPTLSFNERNIDFHSVDGTKEGRPYQKDGVKFLLETGLNSVLADKMRLGKTPQSLLALREAMKAGMECIPCLILVRSANLYQWTREVRTWFDASALSVWPITSTTAPLLPGFKVYVVSMDSIRIEKLYEQLKALGIKCVIADEAHSFKNPSSSRSQALVKLCRELGIQHKMLLTGTPIKNRASEYFVPLNLVAPEKFPSETQFQRRWLVSENGRYDRVSPYAIDAFREEIAPHVLRREKEDVYTDLPEIQRIFTVITIDDSRLKKLYNAELDKIEAKMEEGQSGEKALAGNLMTLRRICGMAKVPFITDYVDIFKEENESDKAKLAIGVHHIDVRNALFANIGNFAGVLELSGADNAESKDRIMRRFAEPKNKFLVLNMMAGGVGMDFHYCNNVIVAERQWNSADEEQFEFRFYNPDRSIMGNNNTMIEYVIADKTIDSFFYDMVEEKRQIFNETVATHQDDVLSNPSNFKALIERTLNSRL